MARLGKKFSIAAILMGAALWAVASPVQADPLNPRFQIQFFEDNVLVLTVQDNNLIASPGQGVDANTSTGVISFAGTVGDFLVSTTFALENGTPSPPNAPNPSPPPAIVQVNSGGISNTSSATHTLGIFVSAQDFSNPVSPPPLTVSSTASGTLASGTLSATFTSYADANNVLFGKGFTLPTQGPFNESNGQSYQNTITMGGFNSGPLYSLSNRGDYTLSGLGTITGVAGNTRSDNSVPEIDPSSMASALTLLGGGMVLLRDRVRRRKLA